MRRRVTKEDGNGMKGICKENKLLFSQKGRASKALCTRDNTLQPDLFGERSGYETRPHVLAALVVGERYWKEQKKNKALFFSVPILWPFFFSSFFGWCRWPVVLLRGPGFHFEKLGEAGLLGLGARQGVFGAHLRSTRR